MIVMVVRYDHTIDKGDIVNIAGHVCVALRTHETERAASGCEDRVEKNA